MSGSENEPGVLAHNMTAYRERRGWSRGQLAERAGVSRSYIGRIEAGKIKKPSAAKLRLIAGALGVPTYDLLPPDMPARLPRIGPQEPSQDEQLLAYLRAKPKIRLRLYDYLVEGGSGGALLMAIIEDQERIDGPDRNTGQG